MTNRNTIYFALLIILVAGFFFLLSGVHSDNSPVNQVSPDDSKDRPIINHQKIQNYLAEFRETSEKLRQVEHEKMEHLEALGKLKESLSHRTLFHNRLIKNQIEKQIALIHEKIEESKRLEKRLTEILKGLAGEAEIRSYLEQHIMALSETLEDLRAEPEKNRKNIENAEAELREWELMANALDAYEDKGIEEVVSILIRPETPIPPYPPEDISEPTSEKWSSRMKHPFIYSRLDRRLARMEEEIHFLEQQLDRLEQQIKFIRQNLEKYPAGDMPGEPERKMGKHQPPHFDYQQPD